MSPLPACDALPALKRGDAVCIVAPSGAFDRMRFFRGLSFLGEYFSLLRPWPANRGTTFTAGTREARLAELNRAIECRSAKAIIAARGGVGATDLLGALNWGALRAHPKWLIGYSDITALHWAWQVGARLPSIHADNVTGLAAADRTRRAAWVEGVSDPYRCRRWKLEVVRAGAGEGLLVGGNLAVLAATLSESHLLPPAGSVLLLEEVAEAPYRVHRALRQLESAGLFDRLSAVIVGELVGCGRPGAALAVIADAAARARIPCLAGLPSGHGQVNDPVTLGMYARVTGGTLTLHPGP